MTQTAPSKQATGMFRVTVRFYGRLGETILPSIEVDVSGLGTIAALREHLARRFPTAAATLRNGRCRACVGDVLVADNHPIASAGCIEFLPPVSGG